jgi:hypothetical protein
MLAREVPGARRQWKAAFIYTRLASRAGGVKSGTGGPGAARAGRRRTSTHQYMQSYASQEQSGQSQ